MQRADDKRRHRELLSASPSGFTLVEMLVVIGIIAVLAGIIFPVLAASRNSARRAMCAANMHQVGVAMVAYSQDHGDFLPPSTTMVPGGHFSTPWQGQLNHVWWDSILPYLGEDRILYCPSAPPYLPGYFMNANASDLEPGRLDDCSDPSGTIFVYEDSVPDRAGEAVAIPTGTQPLGDQDRWLRHSGTMNVCFADIHVKALGAADVAKDSPLWLVDK